VHRRLKRAGLDYWPFVVVKVHDDWSAFHDFFREQGAPNPWCSCWVLFVCCYLSQCATSGLVMGTNSCMGKPAGRGRLIAFSKFGKKPHTSPGTYQKGDWLLFGAETTGLPDEVGC